jgi:hypothetical protein
MLPEDKVFAGPTDPTVPVAWIFGPEVAVRF